MDRHTKSINYALEKLNSNAYKDYIEAIYLFGSCARKNNRFSSDVDILVQYNDKFSPSIGRQMRVDVMPDDQELPEVDLKFVKGSEWKNKTDHFSKNLVKEGVLLWKRK